MNTKERRQAIQSLTSEEFEWLVHSLVKAEEDSSYEVRKMRAPDGGADTLVLHFDGAVKTVIQAKRHNSGINWTKCLLSLERAIEQWKPQEIRFVFSTDFTAKDQHAFKENLIDKSLSTRISAWTMSDLESLLDSHQNIGPRFLGMHTRALTAAVERAARLGGLSLSNARDIVSRANELASFGDEIDPHYIYGIVAGSTSIPLVQWEKLPALTIYAIDGTNRVELSAFRRDGSIPDFEFLDNPEGQQASEQVRNSLAQGRSIEIDKSVFVSEEFEPVVVKEFEHEDGMTINWKVQFQVSNPLPLYVMCDSPHGKLELDLELYSIPPRKNHLS